MGMDSKHDAERFPLLFAPRRVEWAGVDGTFTREAPDPVLVTKIHLVPFVGEHIVVCRDSDDGWFLPGGTLEAEESVEHCAARELLEEAGARLAGPLHHVGTLVCVSDQPFPYRPWQSHPRQAWIWSTADVVVDSAPTNPADGEDVVEVRTVAVAEAKRLLTLRGDWIAELVELSVEVHRSFRSTASPLR
jgi:8-oxo-dGTP diphosphatase